MNKEEYVLWHLYYPEIPTFLSAYLELPILKRLKGVGMNCGMEYTSFPFYKDLKPYSRYEHSISVALIIYHFTKDKKQCLAGLFHDIATPTFSHVVDFMKRDYLKQEKTESGTKEILENCKELRKLLEKDKIKIEEICDYHCYPVADNDAPKLSADRLEYMLGCLYHYEICTYEKVQEYYQDLYVGKNEEGSDEIQFQHDSYAESFALNALKCSHIFTTDEDRYGMEYLASILRKSLSLNLLTEEDLMQTEAYVIDKLIHSPMQKDWQQFCSLYELEKSTTPFPGAIQIQVKKRYIDPLLSNGKRLSQVSIEFQKAKGSFLNQTFDLYLLGRFKNEKDCSSDNESR